MISAAHFGHETNLVTPSTKIRRRRRHLHAPQLCDRFCGLGLGFVVGLPRDPEGDRAAEAHHLHVGRAPAAARKVPARQDAVGGETVAQVPERRLGRLCSLPCLPGAYRVANRFEWGSAADFLVETYWPIKIRLFAERI